MDKETQDSLPDELEDLQISSRSISQDPEISSNESNMHKEFLKKELKKNYY